MLSAPNVAGLTLEIPDTSSCHSKMPKKSSNNNNNKNNNNNNKTCFKKIDKPECFNFSTCIFLLDFRAVQVHSQWDGFRQIDEAMISVICENVYGGAYPVIKWKKTRLGNRSTPWKINGWNLQISHLERKTI